MEFDKHGLPKPGRERVRRRMRLQFDENGLPKPGCSLDAWIAEHVLGFRWCQTGQPFYYGPGNVRTLLPPDSPLWEHRDEAVGDEPLCTLPGYYFWCPKVSTTHACVQVMEAMLYPHSGLAYEWWVYFDQYDLEVKLVHPYGQEYEVKVKLSQYEKLVEAKAHAVCAAAWKAMGGEGA